MVDAAEIYRRFCVTPLRLKKRQTVSLGSPVIADVRTTLNFSNVSVDDDVVTENEWRAVRPRASSVVENEPEPEPEPEPVDSSEGTQLRRSSRKKSATGAKQKRVTRSVELVNTNTGGVYIDTPTKEAQPPKRTRRTTGRRKGERLPEDDEKENLDENFKHVTRNILAMLDDVDEPTVKPRPKRTRKTTVTTTVEPEPSTRRSRRLRFPPQPEPPVETAEVEVEEPVVEDSPVPTTKTRMDVATMSVNALVETKTTSGYVFALWFHAMASQEVESELQQADIAEILRALSSMTLGIAKCEALAMAQLNSGEKTQPGKSKRSVRFRQFDLSSLDLQYVGDEAAAKMVDELIVHYLQVVDHASSLRDRQHRKAHAAVITACIRILRDADAVFRSVAQLAVDQESLPPMYELRACQAFFSYEFDKLANDLPATSTSSKFMEATFSSLISSLVRYRLRELFLPFDPELLHDDYDKHLRIAPYEHQDFGAAIHCALKERLWFQWLIDLMLPVLKESQESLNDEVVVEQLNALDDVEEIDQMERYILASRFLRFSLVKCIQPEVNVDKDIKRLVSSIQDLCSIAKRLGFEDETHLFPLVSIDGLVSMLEEQEPVLYALEQAIESVKKPQQDFEMPCGKCNKTVELKQKDQSIQCSHCKRRFHLVCLHLPTSFLQFASNYTCPRCYIGM
ncbi:hypothetical protein Poli38472_005455 [Pythium oligandrum]|uniref:PHD-type domain-containing protein n=1 Tax=Pythium oligandrum TaxID=41045 RepID=A0A8K1FKH7_PYTOL|nr:hypothetical protein Poli38472_005455 [Pythium oligandrum]|eukprot:TMW62837.1 hypothetical protein Poli38472_005455 [Pythium oligandrum]